jgi:hypothetical protein
LEPSVLADTSNLAAQLGVLGWPPPVLVGADPLYASVVDVAEPERVAFGEFGQPVVALGSAVGFAGDDGSLGGRPP